jgi:hypothetical protein
VRHVSFTSSLFSNQVFASDGSADLFLPVGAFLRDHLTEGVVQGPALPLEYAAKPLLECTLMRQSTQASHRCDAAAACCWRRLTLNCARLLRARLGFLGLAFVARAVTSRTLASVSWLIVSTNDYNTADILI